MPAPKISVLVPIYNAEHTLEIALRSVISQSLADFECVAVDDGSIDGSFELAQEIAKTDSRLRVIRRPHGGIVSTLNAGLALCRGQYVARFDADDLMHEGRLGLQFEQLERMDALAGVGCHVELFPRDELTDGHQAYENWLNSLHDEHEIYRDRFVECPVAHPTICLRRQVFEEFGYRDVNWPEDYDLVLRLLGAGFRIGTVPMRLLKWRDSQARLSRRSGRYGADKFVLCKAHFLAEHFLGSQNRYWLWGYGDTGRALCRALSSLGKDPEYIIERHPGRIGQRIAGALVIAPTEMAALSKERTPIVVSVAGAGPRADVRKLAMELGLQEGPDYCCAA